MSLASTDKGLLACSPLLLLLLASFTTTFALPVATTSDQLGEGANSTDLGRTRRGFAGCSAGFHDVTRGRSYWTKKHHWGCGKGCDGGMYTDWACRCACQPVGCDGLISNSNTCPNSCPEIRFNKYEYSGPDVAYPLTQSVADKLLAANSNAESPVCPNHDTNNIVIKPADFDNTKVPPPTFPGSQGADGARFWEEMNQVVQLQNLRRAFPGRSIADFIDVPTLFAQQGITTLAAASEAVRSDFPTYFPTLMAQKLLSEGATFRDDVVPKRSGSDFVRNQVLLARLIGWAVSEVSDTAFAQKWYYGRPRPEEVAWKVQGGEYGTCAAVPSAVTETISGFGMGRASDFTAYNTPGSGGTRSDCTIANCGSPRHPSFPAMHSAASSASFYLPLVLDLTATQITDLRALDFAVATSRTFAGVHYPSDNRAGLNVGQAVLAKQLPLFIADQFGGSAGKDALSARVKHELEALSYDWLGHDACTTTACSSLSTSFPL